MNYTNHSHWKIASMRDFRDEFSLRYGLFHAGGKIPIQKAVVFLNGRTEWIEKYAELPQELNLPEDCAFLTWDHRGQGGSGGIRAHVDSYEDFARDAAHVIKHAIGDVPYVAISHSMGGLASLYGHCAGILHAHRQVMCAPLLRLPSVPMPQELTRLLMPILMLIGLREKHTGVGSYEKRTFANNILTHDITMFERIQKSPYQIPAVTFGWVKATIEAFDLVYSEAGLRALRSPILILSASEETVVAPRGHHDWLLRASEFANVQTERLTIQGARHEILAEVSQYRDIAYAHIRNWFKDFLESSLSS